MRLLLLSVLATLALGAAGATTAADSLSAAAERGRTAMKDAQCTRCHDVSDASGDKRGLAPAPRNQHCVGCHTWILDTKGDEAAIARYRETYPEWDRYLINVVHFTKLPDLGLTTYRVKPSFVRAYLDAPYDMRPHLDETMVPVVLTDAQKDDIVAYLSELTGAVEPAATAAKRPSAKRIAAGRKAFENSGCASCHLFGNLRLRKDYSLEFYASMRPVALIAPNLRHVRDRVPRDVLVRHITDPQSVTPGSKMPKYDVKPADIELIADFLLYADVELAKAPAALTASDVPLLDRKVSYDEVFHEILGQICVHCHMNADNNGGDGGPGNTGGLGWKGIKLDLETYDGTIAGLVRDGKRISIVEPEKPGEPPLLLKSLLRRHAEAAHDSRPPYADTNAIATVSERPGMPMGLPALSVADLSLIKTWLAQGAKGPGR